MSGDPLARSSCPPRHASAVTNVPCHVSWSDGGTRQDEVAALFDKYNLITLAVVDEDGRLAGIITADDVITMLRHHD